MKKALLYGIGGSFFFAFTFVLNRSMNLGGGYFLWTAALRYFFMLPVMALLLIRDNQIQKVLSEIGKHKAEWFLWSTVGFGLFYAPLTAASVYAESWFTASIWQFTIVAGVLLTPLFGRRIPVKNLFCSCIILAGIMIMQATKLKGGIGGNFIVALLMVVIAAFSYPLGNRKMMQLTDGRLSTVQRVFGMTLCSMPFWIVCAVISFVISGAPSSSQCIQSFCVALFSGVIATILFFKATDIVKNNPKQLAVIEATQSGEVIFTLILGILVLKDGMPEPIAFVGILLIITGMIANSLCA